MTEEQIERAVEKRTDAIDAQYMAGKLSDAEYRAKMAELAAWADEQYRIYERQRFVLRNF